MGGLVTISGLILLALIAGGLTTAIGMILKKKAVWIPGIIVLSLAVIASFVLVILIGLM